MIIIITIRIILPQPVIQIVLHILEPYWYFMTKAFWPVNWDDLRVFMSVCVGRFPVNLYAECKRAGAE
jgi:hypothetical protein